MKKTDLIKYFDTLAETRDHWSERNWYYHSNLENLHTFIIPYGSNVLEIGSGTGSLLAALKPKKGVGVDISPKMISYAKEKFPNIDWREGDAENLEVGERFDYIVVSDLVGYLDDIERGFHELKKVSHERTRLVISYYNYLWEPLLQLAERLQLKAEQPLQNWMSHKDIEGMLELADFEIIKSGSKMVFPIWIPLISAFLNKIVGNLPFLSRLGVIQYAVARPKPTGVYQDKSVSIIIPARNEKGNIESAVKRTPVFGTHQEIIFVEGHSSDDTYEEIVRVADKYVGTRNIRYDRQSGKGKGDAMRKGYSMAEGEVIMILDADLTVPPEDLPKFYNAIISGRGEFINGSRLVYQLEDQSMRFLNILGNKFFSIVFTWLLGQRLKDTLCGTKVFTKSDYNLIAEGRPYFGDFDPFGDFDLIFGAAKLNLKIIEVPIRYQARTYGSTQIDRWTHGWLLLKMVAFAMRKIKFI
ncbi:MAG: glycosyltransferase [bacterium]|nr:glycosyltransferase [bacterium]